MSKEHIDEMAKVIGTVFSLKVSKPLAEMLYNAGYRKQEWISVDERLPERSGRYLTHCNIEGQSLVCILHYSKVGGFNEGTVTHWMPLPDAPKMKGGAE